MYKYTTQVYMWMYTCGSTSWTRPPSEPPQNTRCCTEHLPEAPSRRYDVVVMTRGIGGAQSHLLEWIGKS